MKARNFIAAAAAFALAAHSAFAKDATFAQESAGNAAEKSAEDAIAEESAEGSSAQGAITFSADAAESAGDGGFLHENDGEKHWLVAAGGLLFWNVGLMTYNRFVIRAGWAQVGPDEWNRFWTRELAWDNDWYWTNFVLHPYQGTIYYNIARGANLGRPESFGLTVLGSAMWEYLCETNAPSINDMVYTTVGAFSLGEMLYRLSLEADEIHWLLGLAANPTRIWTQLWTRQRPLGTSGHIRGLSLRLALGNTAAATHLRKYRGDWPKSEVYPVFISPEASVVYGDPYGHDSNDPYSQFELEFGGALGVGSGHGADCQYPTFDENFFYRIRLITSGMLISRAPERWNRGDVATTVGAAMEYDFDWNSYYMLSSLAPGGAVKQRRPAFGGTLEWQAHLAAILLGTSDFYYYHRDFDPTFVEMRDSPSRPYNYNIGAQTKLSARWTAEGGSSLGASLRGYAMYDFGHQLQKFKDGSDATRTGWDFVAVATLQAEYALTRKVLVGVSDELYAKYGVYAPLSPVMQLVNTASAYCRLKAL